MKKPITIGVITVIATILVTSAVDYSAIGEQKQDQIIATTNTSNNQGTLTCPNGETTETTQSRLTYRENYVSESKGDFIHQGIEGRINASLWGGEVHADKFTINGLAALGDFKNFCGENDSNSQTITVWGKCGYDVTVNFETGLGYSGSFTSNVLCA